MAVMTLLGASRVGGTLAQTTSSFGAPAVVPKGSGATAGQEEFAGALGLCWPADPYVRLAWTVAEGGGVNPGQPPNNFLFLTAVTGGFQSFDSPESAAQAVCQTLQAPQYAGVLSSVGLAPVLQLIAVAQSPWDGGYVAWGDPAGHYGGDGRNLVGAYYRLLGNTNCLYPTQPC
jgi:hypothetical protein